MHIQEGTNTTLTTCTKMTEEVDRRHGVNGNSSKGASEDASVHNTALNATGGRLKFFKDGKFILELVRGCAREGERAGWVSVPRKTFWPPAAAPPTPPGAPPAPCASLSASDDNSSLHSSPWQRDHCWKQAAPRRNLSAHLAMYYCRSSALPSALIDAASRRKRRRPHDATGLELDAGARRPAANGVCEARRNGDAGASSPEPRARRLDADVVDGDDSLHRGKHERPPRHRELRVYRKRRAAPRRGALGRAIEKLRERIAALPAPVNAKLANCRQEHAIVSPRKRILREFERVTLEDQSTKRRAKTAPALSTASYPPSPGPSHAPRREPAVSRNVSSYSIHSLLSMPEEGAPRASPEAKRSPRSTLKTESPASAHSPDPSPSPDGYRYRYGALTLGSPGPLARDSPPPELARCYRGGYAPPGSPYGARQWPPCPPAHPAHPAPPAPPHYRSPPTRDEWRDLPYVYPYPYVSPALYRAPAPAPAPPAPPAPAPLWMHYAPSVPPGPWAQMPHPLLTDHIPKDEPTSDLPLNLSKH